MILAKKMVLGSINRQKTQSGIELVNEKPYVTEPNTNSLELPSQPITSRLRR